MPILFSKLNAATVLKFIQDIGIQNFAIMSTGLIEDQCPIDNLLKIIGVELEAMKLDFMFSSYNSIFRTLLPNELTPEFRKIYYMQELPRFVK